MPFINRLIGIVVFCLFVVMPVAFAADDVSSGNDHSETSVSIAAPSLSSNSSSSYNRHTSFYLGGVLGAGFGYLYSPADDDNDPDSSISSAAFSGFGTAFLLGYQFNLYFGLESDPDYWETNSVPAFYTGLGAKI